jgi:hypothetical protein
MIRQTIYIDKYDWVVNAYYYVSEYYTDEIMEMLWELSCDSATAKKAYENLSSGELDTGMCYSNYVKKRSVMVIARTSSAAEFFNSLHHELTHLQAHIASTFRLNPLGEDIAYLTGEVAREIFPKVKHLICDCCRTKRGL